MWLIFELLYISAHAYVLPLHFGVEFWKLVGLLSISYKMQKQKNTRSSDYPTPFLGAIKGAVGAHYMNFINF